MTTTHNPRDRHYSRIQCIDYFAVILHQSLLALLLAKAFDLNTLQIGLVLGIENAAQLMMEVPSGVLADGLGSARAVVLGCILNWLGYAAIVAALMLHGHALTVSPLLLCVIPLILLSAGASLLSGSLEAWASGTPSTTPKAPTAAAVPASRDALRMLIERERGAKFGLLLGASIGGLAGYLILWAVSLMNTAPPTAASQSQLWSMPWICACVIQGALTLYVWRTVKPAEASGGRDDGGFRALLRKFGRLESESYQTLVNHVRATNPERRTQQVLMSMLYAGVLLFPVLWSEAALNNLTRFTPLAARQFEVLGLIWLVTSAFAFAGVALFDLLFKSAHGAAPRDPDAPSTRKPSVASTVIHLRLHRGMSVALWLLFAGCLTIAYLESQTALSWPWLLVTASVGLGLARMVEGLMRPVAAVAAQEMFNRPDDPSTAKAGEAGDKLASLLSFDSLVRSSLLAVLFASLGALGHLDRSYTWLGLLAWFMLCMYLLVRRSGMRTYLFGMCLFVATIGAIVAIMSPPRVSFVHLSSLELGAKNSPGHLHVMTLRTNVMALEVRTRGVLLEDVSPPYKATGIGNPTIVYHRTDLPLHGASLTNIEHLYRIEAGGKEFQSIVVIADTEELHDVELAVCPGAQADPMCKTTPLHPVRTEDFASPAEIIVLGVLVLICMYHGFRSLLARAVIVDRAQSMANERARAR